MSLLLTIDNIKKTYKVSDEDAQKILNEANDYDNGYKFTFWKYIEDNNIATDKIEELINNLPKELDDKLDEYANEWVLKHPDNHIFEHS